MIYYTNNDQRKRPCAGCDCCERDRDDYPLCLSCRDDIDFKLIEHKEKQKGKYQIKSDKSSLVQLPPDCKKIYFMKYLSL